MHNVTFRHVFTAAVLLSAYVLAGAQGRAEVSNPENIKGDTYITNEWFDNWYIGAEGGVFTSFSAISSPRIKPGFGINVLKWFTPDVGVRIGYQGQWVKEYIKTAYTPYNINHSALPFDGSYGGPGNLSYGALYVHGDLMLNLSNMIGGYKKERIYNISPYINVGYLRLYDNEGGSGFDQEIGFGGGLYNTFRISDRLVITADIRHTNTASRYKTKDGDRTNFITASLGLACNIFRTSWTPAGDIAEEASMARAAAQAAVAEAKKQQEKVTWLEREVSNQNETIKEQKIIIDESAKTIEMNARELERRADAANQILFFTIGKDQLTSLEILHLKRYVRDQLETEPDHVFYITGSADKATGSLERNVELSASRARNVKSLLMKEFGIKEHNIVLKATIVSDKEKEGALDRCVLIESK